jgi:hypothetical protein
MKIAAFIVVLSVSCASAFEAYLTKLYVCVDYPYTNRVAFEFWGNDTSKPGVPGWFMNGTNFSMGSTAWEISTNWFLVSRTTNKWVAVSNNGRNCLFIARAVDVNTGLASEWAGHSP